MKFWLTRMTKGISRGNDREDRLSGWSLEEYLTIVHSIAGSNARWDGGPKATGKQLAFIRLLRRQQEALVWLVMQKRVHHSRCPICPRVWWRRCVKALFHVHLDVFGHDGDGIKSVLSLFSIVFSRARDSQARRSVDAVQLTGFANLLSAMASANIRK